MTTFPNKPGKGSLRETMGRAVGWLWAPIIAVAAAARHARMFHPHGIVVQARVTPAAAIDGASLATRQLGDRLVGPAVLRLSSALWKGEGERMDALGLA